MMIYFPEGLQDIQAIIREILGNIDKISPPMSEAICQYGLELFGNISRKSIAHLDRRIEAVLPMHQYLGEVFSGVFTTGEKECYLAIILY